MVTWLKSSCGVLFAMMAHRVCAMRAIRVVAGVKTAEHYESSFPLQEILVSVVTTIVSIGIGHEA